MNIISLIVIGLSLSIDAFTLSLTYGLLNINKKYIIKTSILVGLFHFIMNYLGSIASKLISKKININNKIILLIVLSLILIELIKSIKDKNKKQSLIMPIVFAFLVSVDSFSVGLGISYITKHILLPPTIFMIMSTIFTCAGFTIGKYISKVITKKIKYAISILLFTIILYFLCKW